MSNVLERFEKYLHTSPKHFATNNFERGVKLMQTDYAKKLKYVSINDYSRQYLWFDIDQKTIYKVLKDTGLEPTLIIETIGVGTGHLAFELRTPVSFQAKSHKKPQVFYKAVYDSLAVDLYADPAFAGKFVKNPLVSEKSRIKYGWRIHTFDRTYDLNEFPIILPVDSKSKEQEITEKPGKKKRLMRHWTHSRHQYLFDKVRYMAYREVKINPWGNLGNFVLSALNKYNNYPDRDPLPKRQINDLAKCITSYCLRHKDTIGNDQKNRGACADWMGWEWDPDYMTVQERQHHGAMYTAQLKRQQTLEKIEQAISQLITAGKKATKTEISRLTGLSRQAIYDAMGK